MPVLAPVTIAGLARQSRVDVESIRTYQRLGLLPPPRRRQGRSGAVAYHQEHLRRLVFISRARKLGFSLEAIGEMLGLGGGLCTCADVYRLTERHLAEIGCGPDADKAERVESALKPLLDASPRSGLAKDSPIIVMLSDQP